MSFDLVAALPDLLPRVIAWAEMQSAAVLAQGVALDEVDCALARRVGVCHPEHIRVLAGQAIQLPEDPYLCQAAQASGLLGPQTLGLTLGHALLIAPSWRDARLLAHEFRHVYQYEQAGSIAVFLRAYLQEIISVGYGAASYERDARAHESLALG
jgi:hypothetical protein